MQQLGTVEHFGNGVASLQENLDDFRDEILGRKHRWPAGNKRAGGQDHR
jgi:hypothetical protein